MDPVITINGLNKTYDSGLVALQPIDLTVNRGEIFALLGPNGAGKTTLINMLCGIVTPTSGQAFINGHDVVLDYRAARASVGLVPQELVTETFETPWVSTRYSRGLFGYPPDEAHIERHSSAEQSKHLPCDEPDTAIAGVVRGQPGAQLRRCRQRQRVAPGIRWRQRPLQVC